MAAVLGEAMGIGWGTAGGIGQVSSTRLWKKLEVIFCKAVRLDST